MTEDKKDVTCSIAEKIDFTPYRNLNWVIALSGGADSRMLLELASLNRHLSSGIMAVYVHHHLQKVADDWAVFCQKECAGLGVEFHVEHVTVEKTGSIEANARAARYSALAKYISADNCVLFTAHHADDLLETMIMALTRGCGLPGMSAIPSSQPFASGMLARPMLAVSRSEVEEFCHGRGLDYVTDPTNSSIKYDRNYLRHEVVPVLKKRFPQILTGARRVSENLCDDLMLLDDLLNEKVSAYVEKSLYSGITLNLGSLADITGDLSEKYQSAFIRFFLRHYHNLSVSRKQLAEIMKFRTSNDAKARLMIDNMTVGLYRGYLVVSPDTSELSEAGEIIVESGKSVCLGHFRISLQPETDEVQTAASGNMAFHSVGSVLKEQFYMHVAEKELRLCFNPKSSLRLKPESRNHSQILMQLWKEYGVPLGVRCLHPVVFDSMNNPLAVFGVFKTADESAHENNKEYRKVTLTVEFMDKEM